MKPHYGIKSEFEHLIQQDLATTAVQFDTAFLFFFSASSLWPKLPIFLFLFQQKQTFGLQATQGVLKTSSELFGGSASVWNPSTELLEL